MNTAQNGAGGRDGDRDSEPAVHRRCGWCWRVSRGSPRGPGEVRVNQVGYTPGSPKVAFAMLPGRAPPGQLHGVGRPRRGVPRPVRPCRRYLELGDLAVYQLDFTRLTRVGSYHITVSAGGATAVSPRFAVAPARVLYHQLVLNGVRYFTSERDGGDVAHSVLGRQPANLTDRHAVVYTRSAL